MIIKLEINSIEMNPAVNSNMNRKIKDLSVIDLMKAEDFNKVELGKYTVVYKEIDNE